MVSIDTPWQGVVATSVGAAAFPLLAPNGLVTAPSYAFFGDIDSGLYYTTVDASAVAIAFGGSRQIAWAGGGTYLFNDFIMTSAGAFGFANGNPLTGSVDAAFRRGGSGIIEQRDGANAQNSRIYKTYTDASNYQRIEIDAALGRIFTNWAGTGTAFDLGLGVGGVIWKIEGTTGHFLPATSNAYNIGSASALVGNVFATTVTMSAGSLVTDTTTGLKIGTATTQKLSFWNSTPVVQQVGGVTLTNNVTVGGVDNTIANYTDLVIYVNDAAAIRNNIYQLARKTKLLTDLLRTIGAAQNADV